MGPQLCSCGNGSILETLTDLEGLASMGPQLCSCGNSFPLLSYSSRPNSFNGAATLQLRKPAVGKQNSLRVYASMGPQLCSCGNRSPGGTPARTPRRFNGAATLQLRKQVYPTVDANLDSKLQWGRNFAVAETRILNLCFHHKTESFNGAATLQLRKRRPCPHNPLSWHRFNGAATLQLRKRALLLLW